MTLPGLAISHTGTPMLGAFVRLLATNVYCLCLVATLRDYHAMLRP